MNVSTGVCHALKSGSSLRNVLAFTDEGEIKWVCFFWAKLQPCRLILKGSKRKPPTFLEVRPFLTGDKPPRLSCRPSACACALPSRLSRWPCFSRLIGLLLCGAKHGWWGKKPRSKNKMKGYRDTGHAPRQALRFTNKLGADERAHWH